MRIWDRKEPSVVESLDDILSGFSRVRDKLNNFIQRCATKRDENKAKIVSLEEQNASLSEEIGRAANARQNIERILGEGK